MQELTHNWKVFTAVGRAKELLYQEIQDMLTRLQQMVGFQYIRFHGIFSDDMLVCRRDRTGKLHFSFGLIDKALDFLLSIGLKPMIQFSFMPAALVVDPNKTVYDSPFVISPPRDIDTWCDLVRSFLEHVDRRYGRKELRSWLYSVWSEPDTSQNMFGLGANESYYTLYQHTYQTIKEFDPQLTFGSPSIFPVSTGNYDWARRYLEFTRTNNCLPEFIDIHFYSDLFEKLEHSSANFTWQLPISDDPDYFSKFLNKIRTFLKRSGLNRIPLYITEWNFTVSHRNLLNDTCFASCYLVKNFLENYDRASSFGYWSLTDFLEENQLPEEMYHGGLGLFTYNGVEKPTYYAMQFLSKLGNTLLASGQGYFITRRDDGSVAMILFNYEHCNTLYTEEGFGLTRTSRYGVFSLRNALDVSITLRNLPSPLYRVKESILNRNNGSSFDRWAAGAQSLDHEELQWLREISRPAIYIYQTPAMEGSLQYGAALEPLEVRLVEFIPVEHGIQTF